MSEAMPPTPETEYVRRRGEAIAKVRDHVRRAVENTILKDGKAAGRALARNVIERASQSRDIALRCFSDWSQSLDLASDLNEIIDEAREFL